MALKFEAVGLCSFFGCLGNQVVKHEKSLLVIVGRFHKVVFFGFGGCLFLWRIFFSLLYYRLLFPNFILLHLLIIVAGHRFLIG